MRHGRRNERRRESAELIWSEQAEFLCCVGRRRKDIRWEITELSQSKE
jgi:hypothetical protein